MIQINVYVGKQTPVSPQGEQGHDPDSRCRESLTAVEQARFESRLQEPLDLGAVGAFERAWKIHQKIVAERNQ